MKRKQWEGATHPHALWQAKLGEEFGEVAREQVELIRVEYMTKPSPNRNQIRDKLIEELEHVEFIARNYRAQLLREKEAAK